MCILSYIGTPVACVSDDGNVSTRFRIERPVAWLRDEGTGIWWEAEGGVRTSGALERGILPESQ
jgi:hypothetical protein